MTPDVNTLLALMERVDVAHRVEGPGHDRTGHQAAPNPVWGDELIEVWNSDEFLTIGVPAGGQRLSRFG